MSRVPATARRAALIITSAIVGLLARPRIVSGAR